jgi:hypothetical protein
VLAAHGGTVWASGEATESGTKSVVLWKSTDGTAFIAFPDNYYEGAAGFATGLAAEAGFQYTAASRACHALLCEKCLYKEALAKPVGGDFLRIV